ncbi:MAG: carboxypeptidase-like regulatory domain-containing protein [Patescibacteria group bacterium]|jgi:hypothetical protein
MKKVLLSVLMASGLLAAPCVFAADEVFNRNAVDNGDFSSGLTSWEGTNISESENIMFDEVWGWHYLSLGGEGEYEEAKQTVDVSEDAGWVNIEFNCTFETSDETDSDYYVFSILDHATGEILQREHVYPSDNNENCGKSEKISSYAGKSIDIIFGVNNGSSTLTTAEISQVVITEKSYSKMKGRVFDNDYHLVKNATVTIKRYSGEKIWSGKTNDNGIFRATHLKGGPYNKASIKIVKNGVTKKFYRYIDWGESYDKTFRITEL